MIECTRVVKDFPIVNKMKQNDNKTEFMIIDTPGKCRKEQFNNINICESNISASDKAQNIGIRFDRQLNLNL